MDYLGDSEYLLCWEAACSLLAVFPLHLVFPPGFTFIFLMLWRVGINTGSFHDLNGRAGIYRIIDIMRHLIDF